jgi:hypothetical protein
MKIYNEGNWMEAVLVLCGFTKVMLIPTTSRYHLRFCPMIIANECKYDYCNGQGWA